MTTSITVSISDYPEERTPGLIATMHNVGLELSTEPPARLNGDLVFVGHQEIGSIIAKLEEIGLLNAVGEGPDNPDPNELIC